MSEMEMFGSPWFDVAEGIQKLKEIGMLEWCHLRRIYLLREGPADTAFIYTRRKKLVLL